MSAYVKSTDVNLASNSKFIQVNDGANIGNIREGWPVAINGIVIGFAKVVNTSATPPTIELYEVYTGSAITGGVLLTFPSQGQLTVIGDRITALTNTYEALADSVSITPTANSVVKRDASGRVKTANAVNANEAVALGQLNTRLGTTGNLGTAAARNVGTSSGDIVEVGAFGVGKAGSGTEPKNLGDTYTGFISYSSTSDYGGLSIPASYGVRISSADTAFSEIVVTRNINTVSVFFRSAGNDNIYPAQEFIHTGNTTVDTNGFLKKASPVIKLYSDRIESNNEYGPAFERIDTGHYQLSNTNGLRLDDGWYIETPHDRNGNKYFNVEWEQSSEPKTDVGVLEEPADVTLTIRCYERVWNPQTGKYDNGDPVDIPDGRWIDLRMNEVRQPEPEDQEMSVEPIEEGAEQE